MKKKKKDKLGTKTHLMKVAPVDDELTGERVSRDQASYVFSGSYERQQKLRVFRALIRNCGSGTRPKRQPD